MRDEIEAQRKKEQRNNRAQQLKLEIKTFEKEIEIRKRELREIQNKAQVK